MLYAIDEGHNAHPDTGAHGWIQEDDATRAIGDLVIAKINSVSGNKAVLVTPVGQSFSNLCGSLDARCSKANSIGAGVYVSIHLNACNGQGHGVEVYAMSDRGRTLARPVLEQLSALGLEDRGVLNGDWLYVLRHTAMPAILIEVCFCDSEVDHKLYNPERMASAIVHGLLGVSVDPTPVPVPTPAPSYMPSGTKIAQLQDILNNMGIRDASGCRLVEDGIAGPRTMEAISKVMVGRGQTNSLVGWIQRQLGVTADNCYGNAPYHETYDAVLRFQRSHGLEVDGWVGPKTMKAMISA